MGVSETTMFGTSDDNLSGGWTLCVTYTD